MFSNKYLCAYQKAITTDFSGGLILPLRDLHDGYFGNEK